RPQPAADPPQRAPAPACRAGEPAGRTDRPGLRGTSGPGRGGGGVRGAAVVPARAREPARAVGAVRGAAAPGAGVSSLSRRPRTADLGGHRIDPVQPAPAAGGIAMNADGWNTLVQAEALAAA